MVKQGFALVVYGKTSLVYEHRHYARLRFEIVRRCHCHAVRHGKCYASALSVDELPLGIARDDLACPIHDELSEGISDRILGVTPHLILKAFQLVLNAFALLGLSRLVFGILGDDAVLQVRRLVDVALIGSEREEVVGRHGRCIVDVASH